MPVSASPTNVVFEYLKNGGSIEMAVDGSTPVEFRYTVPANTTVVLYRCNIIIRDLGITPFRFGALTALTNGLKIEIFNAADALLKSFTVDATIKNNAEFGNLAGVDTTIDSGAGGDALYVRWTIANSGAAVKLTAGQYFQVTVQDNISVD
jgi:hypothetical protein